MSSKENLEQQEQKSGRSRHEERYRRWQQNRPLITGILIALSLAALIAVLLLAKQFDNNTGRKQQSATAGTLTGTISTVRLELPFFSQPEYLVGTAAIAYMESDLSQDVSEVLAPYRNGQQLDAGYGVTLNFDITAMPTGYQVDAIRLEISDNKAFDAPRVIPLSATDRSVDVTCLKTGTRYYYRVILTVSDGSEISGQGTFFTADTPRLLSIEGISNVRDFGNWKTETGKTVRQGLLYRGSELDGMTDEACLLTENGKDVLLNILNIKTQLDLRWNVQAEPLAGGAEHRSYGTAAYSELLLEENNKKVRALFADLADPEIYPAYIHCTHGCNQTGTVCSLLGLLLGMTREDVIRAHELSALSVGNPNTESLEAMLVQLEMFEGETLAQKTENYLLSVGVTQQQIDSIRRIFLTD